MTNPKIVLVFARSAALDALSPIGELNRGVWGGDAIYLWAKLPEGVRGHPVLAHQWGFSLKVVALQVWVRADMC
jgi:hypothetical protein